MDCPVNKLKIGYFADGIWAHNTFSLINNSKEFEIKFVCPRFDTKDYILENLAASNNINFIKTENINSNEFLSQIKKYECDIFVSMSFNQIFREEIINLTKYKIINCHAGKLPFYRGRNILNWVLINDEKEFGITVHYVDKGIDTGDIILQRCYPITDNDTYMTILELAHTECASVLYESLLLIKNNQVATKKQKDIHPVGLYCCSRKVGDEIINWDSSSRDIFNFIRAISKPAPMAKSYIGEKEIFINSSKMIKNAPAYKGTNGEIVYKDIDGIVVKTNDSTIKITEYTYDGKILIGYRLKNKL